MNQHVRKIAICGLALLAALGLAEIAVRRLAFESVDTEALRARWSPSFLGPLMRPSADPVLRFELAPSRSTVFMGDIVTVDAEGFRTAPHESRANALRVAVVGASSSFGFGVAFDKTWPEWMRPRLEAALKRPIELRNFSVPGYNSIQQARVFERSVLPWRPDLVLWHYDHRDAFDALPLDATFALPPEYGDNLLHSALVKLLVRRSREPSAAASPPGGGANQSFENYYVRGPSYMRHIEALDHATALARDAHVPLTFVLFDSLLLRRPKSDEHFELLHRPLASRLRQHGARVVDIFPCTMDWLERNDAPNESDLWLSKNPFNYHPNALHHELTAEWVLKALLDDCELIESLRG